MIKEKLKCQDCGKKLTWGGKGRKPKYCPPCKKKVNRTRRTKRADRDFKHKNGKSASRFGELWLLKDAFGNPYAVRREARYVWGATGDNDSWVVNRSGVFHYAGKDGLPDPGLSVSDAEEYADLRRKILDNDRLAKESDEAKAWLKENPDWWRFETFAHESFGKDITDTASVTGGFYRMNFDEVSPTDRCTWCGDRRPLVLANEFCGDACMTDYVTTYGPDGLDLGGPFLEYGEGRGVYPRLRSTESTDS